MKKLAFAFAGLLALAACDTGGGTYVASSPSYGSNDGLNRVVSINNRTGMTMTYFYASSSASSTWGPDQLGPSTVVPSGSSISINFDDGTGACTYDFRAKFSNGQELKKFGVNVCVISNYNYVR